MIAETKEVGENWSRHYDPGQSTHYYYNSSSGLSQWESPSQKSGPVIRERIDHTDDSNFVEQFRVAVPSHKLSPLNLNSSQASLLGDNPGNYSDMDETHGEPEQLQKCFHDTSENSMHKLPDRSESSLSERKQDYFGMARVYAKERPYSDIKYSKKCVLCQKETSDHVFFPCEHHCVCLGCILEEDICAEDGESERDCCNNCPLCGAVIKKILPFDDGNEIELYWAWVYEFPPPLPHNFIKVHSPSPP